MSRFEGVLALAVLLAYAPALYGMTQASLAVDYGSHGPLVPLVSAWLAMRVPRRRWPVCEERDGRGLALILASSLVYLVGLAVGEPFLQGIAFVLTVAGCVLYTRGATALTALWFPIAFLVFMAPLPETWVRPLIFQLQIWVSEVSYFILQSVGYTLMLEGNILILPGEKRLGVEEACSGITSLLTLIPLGLLIAMLLGKSWKQRALVALTIVPAAMLGNLLRVLITVLIARAQSTEFATQESFHNTLGVLTYGVALGCLLGMAALLRRVIPVSPERE